MRQGRSVQDQHEDFFVLAQSIELRDLDAARLMLDRIAKKYGAEEAVQQGRYARV